MERDGVGRRAAAPRGPGGAPASASSGSPAPGAATAEARLVARGVVGLLEAATQDWVDYRDSGLERATDVLFAVLWEGLAGLDRHGIVVAPCRASQIADAESPVERWTGGRGRRATPPAVPRRDRVR